MTPEVLYEDNHLLCVVKPPNMPSQRDSSGDADLLTCCKEYIKRRYSKPGEAYLGLVHRLDRPVGGVMAFARTSKAAKRLSSQMQSGGWKKEYLAVVQGSAPDHDELCGWIAWDEKRRMASIVGESCVGAKEARLAYSRVDVAEGMALLRVQLITGRHHQIRAQLAFAGLPIWGDARYNCGSKPGQQLALWACGLEFEHPTKGARVTLKCYPPCVYPWELFI